MKKIARFFIGEVQAYEAGISKVKGYTYVKDMFYGNMKRKSALRTKVLSIVSGTLIVYQLPVIGLLDWMKSSLDQDGELMLTDGRGFWMDLSEVLHKKEYHGGGL